MKIRFKRFNDSYIVLMAGHIVLPVHIELGPTFS